MFVFYLKISKKHLQPLSCFAKIKVPMEFLHAKDIKEDESNVF